MTVTTVSSGGHRDGHGAAARTARFRLSHHPAPARRGPAGARHGWRSHRGVALVELALILPPLALVVMSAIDLGRMARFQNQLTNAAREGAAIAQYHPGWVGPGTASSCSTNEGRNIIDRATMQNAKLAETTDFSVTVSEDGGMTWPTGCTNAMPASVVPGDRVQVTVQARYATFAPLTRMIWGSSVLLERSAHVEVVGG